ncbi:ATP-binding protein, partial [Photobacterium sp. OFAV2-7]|uniref:ATP-binding protein n=1 Tax=Photobacterium sp. OFAV2-7 TaxID=2917748 RepID=UPI001EF65445
MSKELIRVEVKKDHLNKVSKSAPLAALAELVWNALDADANRVDVDITRGEYGLDRISIKDDGTGIPLNIARKHFGMLGGSWKKLKELSDKGRFLHGKEGQGRFKPFSVGRVVDWDTAYLSDEGNIQTYVISGLADDIGQFSLSEVESGDNLTTGTVVTILEPIKEFTNLNTDKVLEYFSTVFAIYLSKYTS